MRGSKHSMGPRQIDLFSCNALPGLDAYFTLRIPLCVGTFPTNRQSARRQNSILLSSMGDCIKNVRIIACALGTI